MLEPHLPLTVPITTWEAVAESVRGTFADSYLSSAHQSGNKLTTHTQTAYSRLRANKWAMGALDKRGITLVEPLPFGHPDRPDSM